MAIRATYLFESEINPICFYVHGNGYPAGTAYYFYLMQQCQNKCGGLAEQFIRSVDIAVFTKNHMSHWNTRYRYTVDKKGFLHAWKRNLKNKKADIWTLFFQGPWHHFVNQFSGSNIFLYDFKVDQNRIEILTFKQVEARIEELKNRATHMVYCPASDPLKKE